MSHQWTAKDIPSQNGRSFLVTGTGGLGFEVALALCRAGGEVILAGRNLAKGAEAVERIRSSVPDARVEYELLDIAKPSSIVALSERLRADRRSLDVLINNAGVMGLPTRQMTQDGFELQFATNFLGPFALTAHLLPLLHRGNDPRVVMVSSLLARQGKIDFEDLQSARYKPMVAYSQSKLADLIFALEFQRQSAANGWGISAITAHPGVTRTDLVANGPGHSSLFGFLLKAMPFVFQPVTQGALPILYAATADEASDGGYYGPGGMAGIRGNPSKAPIPPQALDSRTASRLWNDALIMTGARYEI